MAIVVPWIGIESTLSLVQARGSHAAAGEPASTAVTIDDLVRAEFWESEEGAEEVKHDQLVLVR